MVIDWLRKLPGYDKHQEKFNLILQKFAQSGVNPYLSEEPLYFQRIKKLLSAHHAKNAYKILFYLYYFTLPKLLTKPDYAALNLLECCPINLQPFLEIKAYEASQCDKDPIVHVEDKLDLLTEQNVLFKNLRESLIYSYINVDSSGAVYKIEKNQQQGEDSALYPDRNIQVVSLSDGINYSIIYEYQKV